MQLVRKVLEEWNRQPRTEQDKSGIHDRSVLFLQGYGHFARECPGVKTSGNRFQEN